jgi:hypothetical protein
MITVMSYIASYSARGIKCRVYFTQETSFETRRREHRARKLGAENLPVDAST